MHSLRICNLNANPPSANSDGWLFPTALRALGSCTADAFLIYGLPLHATGAWGGNKQPDSNYRTLVRTVSYIASILLLGVPTPPLCGHLVFYGVTLAWIQIISVALISLARKFMRTPDRRHARNCGIFFFPEWLRQQQGVEMWGWG